MNSYGLLEEGNRWAGRCPSGVPAVGQQQGPGAVWPQPPALTGPCQTSRAQPPRAATREHPWAREGGKDDFGEGEFSPAHRHVHAQQLQPAELCLLCATQMPPGKDKRVVTRPSYPEGTRVVSTSILKPAFKHLSSSHLSKWMPDLHLSRQGRQSSQGCLGEWQSLWY